MTLTAVSGMTQRSCHIDFETRSKADLKAVGSHKYSADPTTSIWCLAYAFDDDPVQVWRPGNPDPVELLDHVRSGGRVVAHNVNFELNVWHFQLEEKLGWPRLDIDQVRCTMAMALRLGLPPSLAGCAEAVRLPEQKDEDGAHLMRRMCKLDGKNWSEEDVDRLVQYCIQDVEVERQLETRLADRLTHSASEQEAWELDQRINRRGVPVDIPTIHNAIRLADAEKDRLNKKMKALNGLKASQVTALAGWIKEQGY